MWNKLQHRPLPIALLGFSTATLCLSRICFGLFRLSPLAAPAFSILHISQIDLEQQIGYIMIWQSFDIGITPTYVLQLDLE